MEDQDDGKPRETTPEKYDPIGSICSMVLAYLTTKLGFKNGINVSKYASTMDHLGNVINKLHDHFSRYETQGCLSNFLPRATKSILMTT